MTVHWVLRNRRTDWRRHRRAAQRRCGQCLDSGRYRTSLYRRLAGSQCNRQRRALPTTLVCGMTRMWFKIFAIHLAVAVSWSAAADSCVEDRQAEFDLQEARYCIELGADSFTSCEDKKADRNRCSPYVRATPTSPPFPSRGEAEAYCARVSKVWRAVGLLPDDTADLTADTVFLAYRCVGGVLRVLVRLKQRLFTSTWVQFPERIIIQGGLLGPPTVSTGR
jgi:hypothetical protein